MWHLLHLEMHWKIIMKIIEYKLNRKEDARGYFLKIITGLEKGIQSKVGEIYITAAKPGESRGGHFHILATEWFCVIQGQATLYLVDIEKGEEAKIILDADDPKTIEVPPKMAHIFLNEDASENMVLLAYSNISYNLTDTIMYKFKHQ